MSIIQLIVLNCTFQILWFICLLISLSVTIYNSQNDLPHSFFFDMLGNISSVFFVGTIICTAILVVTYYIC